MFFNSCILNHLYLLGDNCQRNPSVCDGNANCVSNGDIYVCQCNSGFRGDGKICYSEYDFMQDKVFNDEAHFTAAKNTSEIYLVFKSFLCVFVENLGGLDLWDNLFCCTGTSSEDYLILSQGKTISRVNINQEDGPGQLILSQPGEWTSQNQSERRIGVL